MSLSPHVHQLGSDDPGARDTLILALIEAAATWLREIDDADTMPSPDRQLLAIQRTLLRHGESLPITEHRVHNLGSNQPVEGDDDVHNLFNEVCVWTVPLSQGQVDIFGERNLQASISQATQEACWPVGNMAISNRPVDATTIANNVPFSVRTQASALEAYLAQYALTFLLERSTAPASGAPRAPRL